MLLPNKDSELDPNEPGVLEEFEGAVKYLPKSVTANKSEEPDRVMEPVLLNASIIGKLNLMTEVRSFTAYFKFLNVNILLFIISMRTQTLLSACKEGEIKAMNILDRALKEKLDEDQTIEEIQEVMREYLIRFRMSLDQFEEELRTDTPRMTPEQEILWKNYSKQITSFNNEMVLFSIEDFIKMIAESFDNQIEKRNDTCAFFRTTIQAFEQTNFVELMQSVYKCSDDSLEDVLKNSSDEVVSEQTLTTPSPVCRNWLFLLLSRFFIFSFYKV